MQWWQHPAKLNVAHPFMMSMLPSIQWQINPPSDTVRVQWPEWQQPQHMSKIMIHPRPASDTKVTIYKILHLSANSSSQKLWQFNQRCSRSKSYEWDSTCSRREDCSPLNLVKLVLCPIQLPVFPHR